MDTSSPTKQPPPLAFVDTETTGLDPLLHDPWEIAVILRRGDGKPDTEHVFNLQPDLYNADPKALEINRYSERITAPGFRWHNRGAVAGILTALLDGAVMIGSNPAFDANMLAKPIGRIFPQRPRPWHYRAICVATMAAGYVHGRYGRALEDGELEAVTHPWSSYRLSRALGIDPPTADVAHTALGDARWARDLYDAITGGDL